MRTVADETAGRDKLAAIVNRRNFLVCGQHNDLMGTTGEEWIGTDDEDDATLCEHGESVVNFLFAAGVQDADLVSALLGRRLHVPQVKLRFRSLRIHQV